MKKQKIKSGDVIMFQPHARANAGNKKMRGTVKRIVLHRAMNRLYLEIESKGRIYHKRITSITVAKIKPSFAKGFK